MKEKLKCIPPWVFVNKPDTNNEMCTSDINFQNQAERVDVNNFLGNVSQQIYFVSEVKLAMKIIVVLNFKLWSNYI